jgi:hypothetical protein
MPSDLAAVLSDPGIIVPQDELVFELIATWAKAPTPTASATVTAIPDTGLLEHLARQAQAAPATTGIGC